MNDVQNPMLAPNKKVALIFYAIMYLLGSGFVLLFVAIIYCKNNPIIAFEELLGFLSDPTEIDMASSAMKNAYAIVSSIGNMLVYIIMFLVVVFYMRDCLVKDAIAFKQKSKRYIGYILASTLIFYSITFLVDNYLVAPFVGESANQESIELMIINGGAIPMFIAVVVCAPIVEELIYRKAIFGLLEKKHIALSYVISTIAFALPHMLSTNFTENPLKWFMLCIPYVTSGVLLAVIYHKSDKNIYATWFIHMVNNLLSFIIINL